MLDIIQYNDGRFILVHQWVTWNQTTELTYEQVRDIYWSDLWDIAEFNLDKAKEYYKINY